MDKTEFDRLVHAAKQADPFQPFEIERDDGDVLSVERRDMLMYGGKAAIFFRPNGEWEIFDHESVRAVRIPATTAS